MGRTALYRASVPVQGVHRAFYILNLMVHDVTIAFKRLGFIQKAMLGV